MKVDVPGRGAVDIRGVAIVGPVWTDPDMYWEVHDHLRGRRTPGETPTASSSAASRGAGA